MAPNLPASSREFTRDMILSKSPTTIQIADTARCGPRFFNTIRSNIRQFGDTRALPIRAGRPRSITVSILEALCDHLQEKPDLYLDEIAVFLLDEFGKQAMTSSIRRALTSQKWSKKAIRQKAGGQNKDLQVC